MILLSQLLPSPPTHTHTNLKNLALRGPRPPSPALPPAPHSPQSPHPPGHVLPDRVWSSVSLLWALRPLSSPSAHCPAPFKDRMAPPRELYLLTALPPASAQLGYTNVVAQVFSLKLIEKRFTSVPLIPQSFSSHTAGAVLGVGQTG